MQTSCFLSPPIKTHQASLHTPLKYAKHHPSNQTEHRAAAAQPEVFSVPTLPRPVPGTEVVHLSLNPRGLVGASGCVYDVVIYR